MNRQAYLLGYLNKSAEDTRALQQKFINDSKGKSLVQHEITPQEMIGTSASYRDVLNKTYGPTQANEFVNDATNWRKSHPQTNFGYDINRIDEKLPYVLDPNLKDDAKYHTWGADVLLDSKGRLKKDGVINYKAPYVSINNETSPAAYLHEGMHDLTQQPIVKPEEVYKRNSESLITPSDKAMQVLKQPGVPQEAQQAAKKEAVTNMTDLKNYARSLGFKTRTPEEVDQFYKFIRQHQPVINYNGSPGVNFYPSEMSDPRVITSPTTQEAAREQLPGIVKSRIVESLKNIV